jgi:hypothetical protein
MRGEARTCGRVLGNAGRILNSALKRFVSSYYAHRQVEVVEPAFGDEEHVGQVEEGRRADAHALLLRVPQQETVER